jgi:23S rRNA (pseudouridine1915-N3)-methyltransferase
LCLSVTYNIALSDQFSAVRQGYELYRKRLAPIVDLSTKWHKTNDAMVAAVLKEAASGASVVLLDVLGKGMTSPDFSTFFFRKLEQGGSRACFVVGGAEGLPRALSQSDTFDKLSLGDMTLTHSFARTLLAEQIYRAAEIRKGSGYHKE